MDEVVDFCSGVLIYIKLTMIRVGGRTDIDTIRV